MARTVGGALALAWILLACQSAAPLGSGCARTSDCSDPLVCRLARCRQECRNNRDCPIGTQCLLDAAGLGACSVPGDQGCGSGGTACPTPLVCANDHCANPCMLAHDCPDDGECRAIPEIGLSFCIAPDRSDAGVPDASAAPDSGGFVPCTGAACTDQLCVGENFACAIRSAGVVCWGDDRQGQLGDGSSPTAANDQPGCGGTCSPTPVTVLADDGSPLQAVRIACGAQSACAVTTTGTIACWGGSGGNGPVSADLGVDAPRRAHTSTALGSGFVQVAGGRYHFCARRGTTGTMGAWCWGQNTHGESGTGTTGEGIYASGDAFTAGVFALGSDTTCSLLAGVVTCAGAGDVGASGPRHFPMDTLVPTVVPFAASLTASGLATGDGFGCALLSDQSVSCWGWNAQSSLGHDIPSVDEDCATTTGAGVGPCDSTPASVAGAHTFAQMWGSGYTAFVCARDTTDQIWCWGQLETGECPFASGPCREPIRVLGFDGAIDVATGAENVCALMADGRVRCVGFGDFGQLGNGQVVARPTVVSTPADVCFGAPCP